MKKFLLAAVAAMILAGPVNAQAAKCLVEEAAEAALKREIELIKATAADVEGTFNGPQGCIDSSIFDLNNFDLSGFIPDLSGMLSSISTDMITNAIQAAKTKTCQAINDQIAGAVGKANDAGARFNSGLSSELQGVLDNGWSKLSL